MDSFQHLADSPLASIPSEELAAICASPGFQILRNYLQNDLSNSSFCGRHASANSDTRSAYILHRDMLHAMIMPVVQLFKRACSLAFAALCTRKYEDLELAFRGEARDAFVWLQCFTGEEEDWCYTRSCPACTVAHTISTESTIRATITASLLSAADSTSTPSSPTASEASDFETASPSLPDFSAILPALHHALDADPFWGPSYYSHLLSRSERLFSGIQELIAQCSNLEALVSSPPSSPVRPNAVRRAVTVTVIPGNSNPSPNGEGQGRGKEINLRKGKMARRQSRLKQEEREVMMRMAWQAWSARQVSAEARLAAREAVRRIRGERKRTLTCP